MVPVVVGPLLEGIEVGIVNLRPVGPARFAIALASRVAGLDKPLDTVWAHFRDNEGLKESADRVRDLGFQGKFCIHPGQVAVVNEAFTPSGEEVAKAENIIAAFEEAEAAGADIVGAEDLMETVQSGKIEFDRCIATPDMMPIVGRLGKVLGPRNLMPNPKVGTVTMDVAEAVKAAKGGEVQFKAEKAGVVHAGVGKASFDAEKLAQNIRAFVDAVSKARPSGAKGTYMKKVSISSTMGPGVSIDVVSATQA